MKPIELKVNTDSWYGDSERMGKFVPQKAKNPLFACDECHKHYKYDLCSECDNQNQGILTRKKCVQIFKAGYYPLEVNY